VAKTGADDFEGGSGLSDLDLLKNAGVLMLNKSGAGPLAKTVIVLGTARSGTTMVAAVLQALGVHMGEKLGPVLEDVSLSEAVERRDTAGLKHIVAQRNATHALWGWKRPSAIEYADVWQGCFRNPYIIAIFRDPFAIANRNRISMLSDVFHNMERSVEQLGVLVQLLQKQQDPILLCSYEKALISPETFVQVVEDFLDIDASEKREEVIRRINPASREYLQTSRITHSLGHLDVANDHICSGWAFYPKQSTKTAKVRILVNDRLVETIEARRPRPDVKEKGIHPTGLCGFRHEWSNDARPQVYDKVEAWVEGDTKALRGSPKWIGSGNSPQERLG
jgi:hypothetical protein